MIKDYVLAAIKDMKMKTESVSFQNRIMLLPKIQGVESGTGKTKYV